MVKYQSDRPLCLDVNYYLAAEIDVISFVRIDRSVSLSQDQRDRMCNVITVLKDDD